MLFVDCVLREVPCIFDFGTSKADGRRNMLVFLPERKGAWEGDKWSEQAGAAQESPKKEAVPLALSRLRGGAGEEQETGTMVQVYDNLHDREVFCYCPNVQLSKSPSLQIDANKNKLLLDL